MIASPLPDASAPTKIFASTPQMPCAYAEFAPDTKRPSLFRLNDASSIGKKNVAVGSETGGALARAAEFGADIPEAPSSAEQARTAATNRLVTANWVRDIGFSEGG